MKVIVGKRTTIRGNEWSFKILPTVGISKFKTSLYEKPIIVLELYWLVFELDIIFIGKNNRRIA